MSMDRNHQDAFLEELDIELGSIGEKLTELWDRTELVLKECLGCEPQKDEASTEG